MKRRLPLGVLVSLGVAVLPACGGGGGGGGFGPDESVPPPPMTAQELEYSLRVFDLVNEARVANDLDPLAWDEGCAQAAYAHAYDMAARNYFDHDDPQGHGLGFRLDREGVDYDFAGENIAQGQATPEDVMDSWMGSSGHRANILEPAFTRIGVGVHISFGGPWWVQDFVGP